jgi:hypothetical protein
MSKIILGNEVPEGVTKEMMELSRELTSQLIPILNETRLDIAATTMAMLLGQNIAHVLKHDENSEYTLETLVDRITLAVRTSAEASLADDDSNESHRNN